jgi:hypothetical protein
MVAYVRCEGAEQPRGRFPCPRDRRLEADVWHALAALGSCASGDPGSGQGEARLDVQGGRVAELELRPDKRRAGQAAGLDLAVVSKCAEPQLRALRSSLHVPRFIVAFRFGLR